LVSLCGETVATVDRTFALGLKGYFCLLAAIGAGGGKVLAGAAGSRFTAVTAGFAALGLVLKAALGIEFLFTGGEREILIALLALYRSVLVHALILTFASFILRSA